jgi:exopolyphosphatase/pppGpp-phosphohydrolase
LLRNLSRFKEPEFAKEFPVVSSVFQRISRHDIVYLAAIFHDIAKGRGGDHSELGALDAIEFCRTHGFTERECKLVAWLINNHLLLTEQDITSTENTARCAGLTSAQCGCQGNWERKRNNLSGWNTETTDLFSRLCILSVSLANYFYHRIKCFQTN